MLVDTKIIISPPFGNWIDSKYAYSIAGTFTSLPRPGKWLQALKTVRKFSNGWVNKIGLRNEGFWNYCVNLTKSKYNKIVSIYSTDYSEIKSMIRYCHLFDLYELNLSCPNIESNKIDYEELFSKLNFFRSYIIIKLPPINYENIFRAAYINNFKKFHCCNTYPSKKHGGISGKFLKPYSLKVIKYLKSIDSSLTIIGGGGISSIKDIYDYKNVGTDYFSLSSAFFNPLTLLKLGAFYKETRFFNSNPI